LDVTGWDEKDGDATRTRHDLLQYLHLLAQGLRRNIRRAGNVATGACEAFDESDLDGTWQTYGATGCEQCKGTGYKGRIGIFEVLPISEEMTRMLMKNGSALDIAAQARSEGVRNLRQSGLLKVRQGMTSLEEIESITNE